MTLKIDRNTATISGCKAYIKLNGIKLAMAQECNYSLKLDMVDIDTIDDPETKEFAAQGYKIEFGLSYFRVYKKSAMKLGFVPKLLSILDSPEIVFEIREKLTDNIMLVISQAKLIELTGGFNARNVWVEQINFKAKKYEDEETYAISNLL